LFAAIKRNHHKGTFFVAIFLLSLPNAPVYMQQSFEHLDKIALTDLLAEHTAKLTQLMKKGGNKEEYDACKETIQLLLAEIELRQSTEPPRNVNTTSQDISLTE
jgi:hypothetical protein